MIWSTKQRARERILAFGPPGTGKSAAAVDLISHVTGGEQGRHVYVIDTDNSYGRLLESTQIDVREEYLNGKVVEDWAVEDAPCSLYVITDGEWETVRKGLDWAINQAAMNDWVVVDGVTMMWAAVKDWAIQQAYGTDMPTFMLKARLDAKDAKDKSAKVQSSVLDLYEPIINPAWHDAITQPLIGAGCHLYVVADENTISPRAGKDITTVYEAIGGKPDTQKRVGHNVATILHTLKTRLGDYQIEMVKDWGREDRWNGPISMEHGFVKGYLKGVAGWRPTK